MHVKALASCACWVLAAVAAHAGEGARRADDRVKALVAQLSTSGAPGGKASVGVASARAARPGAAPGGAIGVLDLRAGRWRIKDAFGFADLAHAVANTGDTVFGIASVSKQFTATLAAIAAEEGRFSLGDDIRRYLPEIPDYGRTITIRDLIHHTNGLRDDGWLVKLTGKPGRYATQEDLIRLFARQRGVNFPAGREFRYGNTAYVLLAQILERTTHQALHDYAREKIFAPLGMIHTYFVGDPAAARGRAVAYQLEDGAWVDTGLFEPARRGAGGVMTTLDDFALWVRNLLSPDSRLAGGSELLKLLRSPARLADGSTSDYGFGLELGAYRGVPTIGHDGSGGGYKADTLILPEQSLGIFAFRNDSVYPADTVLRIADLYLDATAKSRATAREPAVTLTAAQLDSLVGIYREPSLGSIIGVERGTSGLTIRYNDPRVPIESLSATRFRTAADQRLEFERDSSGRGRRIRQLPGGDWTIGTGVFERIAAELPTARQLDALIGAYRSDELDSVYELSVDADHLTATIEGAEPGALGSAAHPILFQPTVANEFVSIADRMVLRFERDATGRPCGFLMNAQHGWVTGLRFERRAASDDSTRKAAIAEAYLNQWLAKSGAPGVSAAVAVAGRIAFSGGVGFSNLENSTPLSGRTVHNIGSISKTHAVVALMQLVEQGRVSLDAPIQDYVPWFPRKSHRMTVRQILTHTSGIRHYRDGEFGPDDVLSRRHFNDFEEATRFWRDDPLLFEPGTHWYYSSYATTLMQAVVERVSGEPFERYMRTRVWGPAGMNDTSFDVPSRIVPRRGRGYAHDAKWGQLVNAPAEDVSYKYAGGGVISTDEDLCRFGIALDAGVLLKAETLAELYALQLPAGIPYAPIEGSTYAAERSGEVPASMGLRQGLIFVLDRDAAGHRYAGHSGSVLGTESRFTNYYEDAVVVAIHINLENADREVDMSGAAEALAKVYWRK